MRVAVVCVGTELLAGKVNTNAAFIGERLDCLGLELSSCITVGDRPADMENVFAGAVAGNDIVIITGGLGPTFDDITREAVADALKTGLETDAGALAAVRQFFDGRGIPMPPNNERQAQVISGARLIGNRVGTAPGQIIEHERRVIFLLPGPPKEMQQMFDESVMPYLRQFEAGIKKHFTLHVFGMGESAVDEKIRPVIESARAGDGGCTDFTILAHQMIIDIKASCRGRDELLADETLAVLKSEFYRVLGGNIFGEGAQSLESVAGELLNKHHKTIALAESCTGGLIADKLTSVAGSSLYFREAVVAYSNEAKIARLGVKHDTLAAHGAVAAETAREMAEGILKTSGASLGLSVTGIAGPGGGTAEKPVGLVFIGIAGHGIKTEVSRFVFAGQRNDIRHRAANQALDIIRRKLLTFAKK